ncbi:MAG: hypothetical protein CMI58_05140 [Parcubacteria group bacterium]|jgi:sialic acid synthase SpsE|nr:hypothetical protein [Parcubacteria group bacterium]|tara:strand:- start:788 stop:1618 length:831 start_codon:yes stop_codon:yes gene_type:complete
MVKNIFSRFNKPYIIAEAGINHNGNLKTAYDLVDIAKKNGADAIKFQTYDTKKRIGNISKKISKILEKCELSFDDFEKINNYCKRKKITFFSTPFDEESVDFLEYLKVPFYKIASFDISNYQLVNKIIKTKKPTIASIGMASLNEIKKIHKMFYAKGINLVILHCISSYPNDEKNSYLSNILFLQKKFKCPIGISDHTNEIKIPIYGTLLGAKIIEKHIKINHAHKCVDSKVSITGKQLKTLRKEVDKISVILNKPKFGVRPEEISARIFKRRKIF